MNEQKVINSEASRTCACADCVPGIQTGSQTGFIDKPISSQTAPACVRTREERAAICNPEAYFKAWRKNKIDSAMRKLDAWDRAFARAVLQGKSWQDMGIAKSTFSDSLKRIEKILRGL